MMSLTQTERLIRKIEDLLGQPALEAQAAKLAHDYVELARAANRRLEQCATMIEAGEEIQALQLAETPPPLLNLITVLSFRQASEWRTHCQSHGLPFVEPFYDKFVRVLNQTYGKGIASDHPCYRDFRRAMMQNDDERALSILRVIVKLNPGDENTLEEFKRLEDKIVRGKLASLRGAMQGADAETPLKQLAELETSALPIPPNHPVWQEAQLLRCRQLLRKARELYQADAWQEAELVVEEVRALADRHRVALTPEDVADWERLEKWTSGQRQSFVHEQNFQRALSGLEYQVQSSQAKLRAGHGLGLAELQAEYDTLAKKWRELEGFGQAFDANLLSECQQICDRLEREIRGKIKRKRLTAIGATVLSLAALVAAGFYAWDLNQQKDLIRKCRVLAQERRVSETQKTLEAVPARVKSKSAVAETLGKADQFVSRELDLKRSFEQKLGALQAAQARNFDGALEQAQALKLECAQALERLAPEFQPEAKSKLLSLEQAWQRHLAALQPARNAEFSKALNDAEVALSGLDTTNGYAGISQSLPQARKAIAALDAMQNQPVPLDEALATRFADMTNRVSLAARTLEDWDKSEPGQSRSLEDYLERLQRRARLPLATAAERDLIEVISRTQVSQPALLGGLLLPGQPGLWPSLTNLAALPERFTPDSPSPEEKAAYNRLCEDENMENIFFYRFIPNPRPDNTLRTNNVLARGDLRENRAGRLAGLIYDPRAHPDALHFERYTNSDWDYKRIEPLGLLQEAAAFQHRIRVRELIDSNTGRYQKSVLEVLDQINAETDRNDASRYSSPLFCGWLSMRVFELARLRPTDWGLQWCPSAAHHLQELEKWSADKIQSGDWMVPDRLRHGEDLQKCFDAVRGRSFQKEGIFLQRLARRACEAGFDFAGFVDAQGKPRALRPNVSRGEYWGWSAGSRTPALVFRTSTEGEPCQPPLAFSPLFALREDRRALLAQAANSAQTPISTMEQNLPPLFSGLAHNP
jgi:hypothetical protein